MQIDPVFSVVTAVINPLLMSTGQENFWRDIFGVIQRSCGVHCQTSTCGMIFSGTLSQVANAGEILELQWKKHMHVNQGEKQFQQAPTHLEESRLNFNQSHVASNQYTPMYNQYGMTNWMDNSFREEERMESGHNFYGIHDQFSMGGSYHSMKPESQSYNQYPYPGFVATTGNPQSLGSSSNTSYYPQYQTRSPSVADTTPGSGDQQRSLDSTMNSQKFGNPAGRPPPGFTVKSSNSTMVERDQLNDDKIDPVNAKSEISKDSANTPERLQDEISQTSEDTVTEVMVHSTPKIEGTSSNIPAKPENSSNRPTKSQEAVNYQDSATATTSKATEKIAVDDHQSVSPANIRADSSLEIPLTTPQNATVDNQENAATGSETLTTFSDPLYLSLSKQLNAQSGEPAVLPSQDLQDTSHENPPGTPKSTINPHTTTSDTPETVVEQTTGPQTSTNNTDQSEYLVNETSKSDILKQPHLPDQKSQNLQKRTTASTPTENQVAASSTYKPDPPTDTPETVVEQTTGPQTSTNNTDQSEYLVNETPKSDTSTQSNLSDQKSQQLQKTTTASTPTENQIAASSINKPDSPTGKTHHEKAPDESTHDKQDETITNEPTADPESSNTEVPSDKSPVPKVAEKSNGIAGGNANSNSSPEKRPPVPKPRNRKNAATFKPPGSAKPAVQLSPSTTESSNDFGNGKSIVVNSNKEENQDSDPAKSESSKRTNKNDDNAMLDEELD